MESITSNFSTSEIGHGHSVLLIPGLAGLGRFWEPVMTLLADRFHLIAMDHPGMGGSRDRGPQSIATTVEAVIEWMDARDLNSCSVVGHSTGGLIAQSLALDHADRITALVLSSTWATTDRRFRDLFKLRQHILRHAGSDAYALLGQLLAYPPQWYESELSRTEPPELDLSATGNEALISSRIDMLLSYTRAAELASVHQPTLVIGAQDDNIVPFHHSEELSNLIPGAQLHALHGGHFTPTTRTGDYANVIATFLSPYSAISQKHRSTS